MPEIVLNPSNAIPAPRAVGLTDCCESGVSEDTFTGIVAKTSPAEKPAKPPPNKRLPVRCFELSGIVAGSDALRACGLSVTWTSNTARRAGWSLDSSATL
jgi:hypothetical protein